MKTTELFRLMIVTAFALMVWGTVKSPGQSARSLTEKEIESSETRTTLEAALRDNAELRKKFAESEASVTALQRNLAGSTAEAEVLKRKISELTLRFEALGLEAAGSSGQLEQRLLKAVSDLRIAETDREALKGALIDLVEAVIRYQGVAQTTDAEARVALEAAQRAASKALGGFSSEAVTASPAAATLTDAMVIAVKDDLALVVTNVGRKHGVQVGMPFRIVRGGNDIGTVRVVQVREKIAGAVVQDLQSDTDKIQVGDRLKVGVVR
jgi:hypothetical protein